MNKKGQLGWGHILAAFITLVLAVSLVVLLGNYFGIFVTSTSQCQGGYMCVDSNVCDINEGYKQDLKGQCAIDEQICCTSSGIKQFLQNRVLPLDDRSIVLKVEGIVGEYPVGRQVELFLGTPYTFEINVHDDSIEDKWCHVTIVDNENKPIIVDYKGFSKSSSPKDQFKCEINNNELKLKQGNTNLFDDVKFRAIHIRRNLKLKLLVYEDYEENADEKLLEASFPIRVVSPFQITEPKETLARDHDVTVQCRHGGCTTLSLVPSFGPSKDSVCANVKEQLADFRDKRVDFTADVPEGEVTSGYLCFIGVLESGEEIQFMSFNNVTIDREPPKIEADIINSVIQCSDGEGSGCKDIYYYVWSEYTLEELQNIEFNNLEESLREEAINFIFGKVTDLFTQKTGTRCAEPGKPGDPIDPRYTRKATSGYVSPNIVGGQICVIAVDRVGNPTARASKLNYINHKTLLDELGTEATSDVNRKLNEFFTDI